MDILVIGGGPGGYVAAIAAAKKGAHVKLIERDRLGGTCLNRGCIPTKAILHSAAAFHNVKKLSELGIKVSEPILDYSQVAKRKDAIVEKLVGGIGYLFKKNNIELINGEACFIDEKIVSVNGKEYTADKIIIASGSHPAVLPFAKADGNSIWNSDHALSATELPKSIIIVGGGVIGCEFAQAYARMGLEVTLIEMLPCILANMDAELSILMTKVLQGEGVKIHCGCTIKSVKQNGDTVVASVSTKEGEVELEAEKLLAAPGRRPNTEGLGLEKTGVELNETGFIQTDEFMQTTADDIYAIGDVTGKFQLAHVASHQGIIAVKNIFGESKEINYEVVPQCIYTSPELAAMGRTEKNAECDIKVGKFSVSANGRAMIEGERNGFAKVVLDAGDDRIIGVHLAGPNVTEMISGMASIIGFEATAEDMESFIFAHPTVSEIIGESLLDTNGAAIHK